MRPRVAHNAIKGVVARGGIEPPTRGFSESESTWRALPGVAERHRNGVPTTGDCCSIILCPPRVTADAVAGYTVYGRSAGYFLTPLPHTADKANSVRAKFERTNVGFASGVRGATR